MKQPMQKVCFARDGVIRFHENKIVSILLDFATPRGMGMNEIACLDVSQADREQFAQLIGYSVSGFGDLSYVSDRTYAKADRRAEKLRKGKTR